MYPCSGSLARDIAQHTTSIRHRHTHELNLHLPRPALARRPVEHNLWRTQFDYLLGGDKYYDAFVGVNAGANVCRRRRSCVATI